MAAVDIGANNNPPAPTDDLDDLFDYNVPADIFRDDNIGTEVPNRLAKAPLGDAGTERTSALGIDKEIKITKRRAPVAKLDENKLLSQAGLPRLRRIAKERLKFKGKGHEYSDVARLLNVYQLWLDDLYPRAKFADGLAIIEKLGHKKRLQAMRKEWINESKPKGEYDDRETTPEISKDGRPSVDPVKQPTLDINRVAKTQAKGCDIWNDDDLFLPPKTLPETMENLSNHIIQNGELSNVEVINTAPPEDDLDALLAEDALKEENQRSGSTQQLEDCGKDNFDDEMEVMAGMDMW